MSQIAVIWIIGILGVVLYCYALTLPPDKPDKSERHCREGRLKK